MSNKNNQILNFESFQIDLHIQSFDKSFINEFCNFLKNRFVIKNFQEKEFLIEKIKFISLPKKRNFFTVLRSPHVNKTARDQFEMRICKKLIQLNIKINPQFMKIFLNILKSNAVGISLKIMVTKL